MPKPEPALRADDATSSCVHTTTSLPTLASALCSSSSPLRVGWSRERALVHCSTPLLGGSDTPEEATPTLVVDRHAGWAGSVCNATWHHVLQQPV